MDTIIPRAPVPPLGSYHRFDTSSTSNENTEKQDGGADDEFHYV